MRAVKTRPEIKKRAALKKRTNFRVLFGEKHDYTGRARQIYKCMKHTFDNDPEGMGESLRGIVDAIALSTGMEKEEKNPFLNPEPRFYPEITDELITFNTGTPNEYDRPFGGWVKFMVNGFHTDDDIFRTHLVAYHGTSSDKIGQILRNGLKTPRSMGKDPEHGDALREEGEQVGNRVYLSPCINYSAHPVYSPLHELRHVEDRIASKQFVQFVFQVRVAPNSYTSYKSTLESKHWPEDCAFDPAFEPDSIYEWATLRPPVVTGLFVRILGNAEMEDVFGKFASQEFTDEFDWSNRFAKRVKKIYKKFR